MNFDKIKKVAKDTIRKVSDKVDEKLSTDDELIDVTPRKENTPADDFDDFSMDNDYISNTQTFDIKDALNRFRKRKDGFEGDLSEVLNGDTQKVCDKGVDKLIESNISDLKKNISDTISDIDSDISKLSEKQSHEMEKVCTALMGINAKLDELTTLSGTRLDNADVTLNSIERKLIDISSMVSGVAKLSDGLFDLKNSQINTKNAICDLELAYNRLKKKMTAGITIISVISAVIAVLEVINLLS